MSVGRDVLRKLSKALALALSPREFVSLFETEEAPMPEQPSIADLMREWRRLARLTRTEAAARLSMAPGTLRDIEQGLSRSDDMLARLALDGLIAAAKKSTRAAK